jgi:hypothetical protein
MAIYRLLERLDQIVMKNNESPSGFLGVYNT